MEIARGIWIYDAFLGADRCGELIRGAEDHGFSAAPINIVSGASELDSDIRDNSRVIIDDYNLAFELWQIARMFVPPVRLGKVAIALNERFRVYRYQKEERFTYHQDFSFRRENGEHSLLTFMIYLNEDFEGGETEFVNDENTVVRPMTGRLLVFDHNLFHQGRSVLNGTKYVLRTDIMFSK